MQNTCIDIEIRRVDEPLSFGSQRLGDELDFSASRVNEPLHFGVSRDGSPLGFSASRKGSPLEFRCGLVCSVGAAAYLNVEPEFIWLLPGNDFSADVVVYSNVTWRIE